MTTAATNLSVYLGNKLLSWFNNSAFPTALAHVWARLFIGDPEGTPTEVTGAGGTNIGLVGVDVFVGGWTYTAGTTPDNTGTLTNAASLAYGTATGPATGVNWVGLFDAQTAGNCVAKIAVSSFNIATGNIVSSPIGDIALSF